MNEVNKDLIPKIERPDVIAIVKEMFATEFMPDIKKAIQDKLGIYICNNSINKIAKSYGIKKDKAKMRAKYTDIINRSRPKSLSPEALEKRSATRNKLYKAERLRESACLERKTKIPICLNRQLSRKREWQKSNIIRRNNYFPDTNDKRVLYYDEETRRSRYIEERYKNKFFFCPAEGFNEEDSVFIN